MSTIYWDIGLLDSDPYVRDSVIDVIRLVREAFPSGLKHTASKGDPHVREEAALQLTREESRCLMCCLVSNGIFVKSGIRLSLHPDFAPFIAGTADDDYINAVRGFVAMQSILDDTPDNTGDPT